MTSHDDDIGDEAARALEHDVVAPLDLARHLLASVVDAHVDDVARDRVGVVIDALGEVEGRAHDLAQVLRRPPPPRREPSSLRGLAAAAWKARAGSTDDAAFEVVLGAGVEDRVVADVARLGTVLDDLIAFATCAPLGSPAHVTMHLQDHEAGLEVVVHDTGATPVARRHHELGSLCFARTLRIVGQNVDVDEADGVRTSITVSEDLVRGTTA